MKAGDWHTRKRPTRPIDRFIALLCVFAVSTAFCDLLLYSVRLDLVAVCTVSLLVSIYLVLKGAELLWHSLGRTAAACRAGAYSVVVWHFIDRFLLLWAAGASLVFLAVILSDFYEIYIPLFLLLFIQAFLRLSRAWRPHIDAHSAATKPTVVWSVRVYQGTQFIVAIIVFLIFLYAGFLCVAAGIWVAGNALSWHMLRAQYGRLLCSVGVKKSEVPWRPDRERLHEALWTLLSPLSEWIQRFVRSSTADHLMGKYGREFFLERKG